MGGGHNNKISMQQLSTVGKESTDGEGTPSLSASGAPRGGGDLDRDGGKGGGDLIKDGERVDEKEVSGSEKNIDTTTSFPDDDKVAIAEGESRRY